MLWIQIETESILKHLANYYKLVEVTIAKDMTDKTENLLQSEDEYDPALFEVAIDDAKLHSYQ